MKLIERFYKLRDLYTNKFIKKQGFDKRDVYWIGEGLCSILSCNEEYYFNFLEIAHDVECNIETGFILEWFSYVIDAKLKNENAKLITYIEYIHGTRYEK